MNAFEDHSSAELRLLEAEVNEPVRVQLWASSGVRDDLEAWALSPPPVLLVIGFLQHPLGRTHVANYTAGEEIVGKFAGTHRARYLRLLREPFTPADLLSAA